MIALISWHRGWGPEHRDMQRSYGERANTVGHKEHASGVKNGGLLKYNCIGHRKVNLKNVMRGRVGRDRLHGELDEAIEG